ncbi:MAG TPA: hypothetical protein VJI13_05990 [Candidatus Norongarragalinales archaeon]|nr:hypothetical protein [Candidatus Norongarragalinales archaeon]
MAQLLKALLFGGGVWFSIEIIGWLLQLPGIVSIQDSRLLMIPISVIIIVLGSMEYLKEIHAQYEQEGLEIAIIWLIESVALEIAVFGIFFGLGFEYFLSIGLWLGVSFKFVLPLASGIYMQHTISE